MNQTTYLVILIATGTTWVNSMAVIKTYDNRDALFDSMAEQVTAKLNESLLSGDTALVVSGGTTPQPLFERLSQTPLAWDKVTLLPSDERWLATNHEASNEHLIRNSLHQNLASMATVQSLMIGHESAQAAESDLNQQLATILDDYAVAIVGMGLDGHFASIFPGTPQIDAALDLEGTSLCYGVDATGCPVAGEYTERMTLSLPAILNANAVFVLITGDEKLAIVNKALAGAEQESKLPIAYLLNQSKTPVTVCCA